MSTDRIQRLCIAKMKKLNLNPNQVAKAIETHVSRTVVYDFLAGRASMGSEKLQYLLEYLGIKIE